MKGTNTAGGSHAFRRSSVLEHRPFLPLLLLLLFQRPALGADVQRGRVPDSPGCSPLIRERGVSALPLAKVFLRDRAAAHLGEMRPSHAAGTPGFTPGFFQPSSSSCSVFPESFQMDGLCLSQLLLISLGFSVFLESGLGADSSPVQASYSLGCLLHHLESSCRYPQQTLLGLPSSETGAPGFSFSF